MTRVVDYAFRLAATRRGRLTSATESNGIVHTLPFWDEVVAERAADHPDVRWDQEHIDAPAAKFVLQPERFDVVVGRTCSATSSGTWPSPWPGTPHRAVGQPRPHARQPRRCSSRCTGPRRTSRAAASRTPWAVWSAALMLDRLGHPEAAARRPPGRRPTRPHT